MFTNAGFADIGISATIINNIGTGGSSRSDGREHTMIPAHIYICS